jgi:hypothetical protein
MLTIKFMNSDDLGYRVHHVDHFAVEDRGQNTSSGGTWVVLNPGFSSTDPTPAIPVDHVAYVVNEHGKTIDTIWKNGGRI